MPDGNAARAYGSSVINGACMSSKSGMSKHSAGSLLGGVLVGMGGGSQCPLRVQYNPGDTRPLGMRKSISPLEPWIKKKKNAARDSRSISGKKNILF